MKKTVEKISKAVTGKSKAVAVKKKAASPAGTKKTPAARQKKVAELKPSRSKVSTEQIVLTSLSVGVAGVLGYFGYQYLKKMHSEKTAAADEAAINLQTSLPPDKPEKKPATEKPRKETHTGKSGSGSTDNFPLKKGSKGELVRKLQEALIAKYGNAALPKYGADSDFGTETYNALKKNGLPTTVTESIFNVITEGGSASETAAITGLAEKLYKAATAQNATGIVSLLKNIGNKDQYQQVSNSFMQYRLHGVRQTLVNGLLSSFTNEAQKQKIRFEFIRMGLQYNGDKWSLSGFGGKTIATTEAATVWVNSSKNMQVPAMMILGTEVAKRMDYTLFENDRKYFLIKTQSIKYI